MMQTHYFTCNDASIGIRWPLDSWGCLTHILSSIFCDGGGKQAHWVQYSENRVGLSMYTAIFIQKRLPPATTSWTLMKATVFCVYNKDRISLFRVLHSLKTVLKGRKWSVKMDFSLSQTPPPNMTAVFVEPDLFTNTDTDNQREWTKWYLGLL